MPACFPALGRDFRQTFQPIQLCFAQRNALRHEQPSCPPKSDAGGVTAVTRALQLLEAFALGESRLSLAELSRRAGLHKTTVLRLARTLAQSGYMVQREDGDWRLGPAAGWLGARYQAGFDVQNVLEPALRELTQASGESAAFYVREGNVRTCLVRVEGPQALRHHARMGEGLPLDKGSPGRVILAFSASPARSTSRSARRAITGPSASANRAWPPCRRPCSACTGG